MKYKYSGAMYNGNVIYKQVIEYVTASNPRHAIQLLERRLKSKYPNVSYIKLKEANLTCIK